MPGPTAATEHIGTRIRYWRRRRNGMTQAALAGLAGLSQSFISHVESGHKSIERRSTLVAVANALQVSVPDLLGQPGDPTDPRKAAAVAAVPAIRVALVEIEEGERRAPARGPDEMAAAVDHIDELRIQSDFAAMAGLLPGLLYDAAAYGGVTLVRVAAAAPVCLRTLGYRDLSRPAAQMALSAALDAEDPAWISAARFVYSGAMPVEAAGTTRKITDRAVAELQANAADPRVRQMLGMLHLAASLASAVDGRPDDAQAHLRAAGQEARTLGDPEDGRGFYGMGFGPTNVGLWRMTVAAELGEHGRVVELAEKVHPGPLRIGDRHFYYWLDKGRALAHSGKTDARARAAFLYAERVAPQPFSLNPMAHDAVLAMVNRAKRGAVPKDLRVLALRLGIEVTNNR